MCYDPEWTQRQGSVIWVRSGRDQRGAVGGRRRTGEEGDVSFRDSVRYMGSRPAHTSTGPRRAHNITGRNGHKKRQWLPACGLVQFHRLQISRRRFVPGHPTHIKINTDEGLECWNLDERAAWAGLGYHLLRQSLLPVPAGVL